MSAEGKADGPRIGVVAAEPSADQLGGGLLAALRRRLPGVQFEGIGGPAMQLQGLRSWHPMEALSVMGLVEVLAHLPRLLGIRRNLRNRWRRQPPDLFIGIDAPDFNLGLARALRRQGVPTVQYVSPTVWAWRQGRVHGLKRSADLVLSIFPFEGEFLERHGVHVRYVGHPLAAELPLEPDRASARARLGLDPGVPVLALLPGSRLGEISRLARPFLQSALVLAREVPELQILTPTVNRSTRDTFRSAIEQFAPALAVRLLDGGAQEVLTAADLALTASGTATFEALLCRCPMVVGYKVHGLTYALARGFRLVKIPHVAMANLLSGESLAAELLQERCEPEYIVPELLRLLREPQRVAAIRARYREVHELLRTDTNELAAAAVAELLADRGWQCS